MKLTTSYQREINNFCRIISEGDYNIKEVTAGALSQARAKLNPWAFIRLSNITVESFYAEAEVIKWHEMRLLAVDGSTINLPSSKSIIEEFGKEEYIQKNGAPKSLGRASLLYDVLNEITIDAQLKGYRTSEKELFINHLEKITTGDLILGDRGYGTTPILHMLASKGVKYCIRMKSGNNARSEVVNFLKRDIDEDEVFFSSQKSIYKRMGMDQETKPFKVRLVKVYLDSGEIEILATNLFDSTAFPVAVFKELYFMRWQVEEAYKLLKLRLDLESFSGRTARSIQQDFHAKIFMMNLCATLSHPIAQKVKQEYKAEKRKNKYDQQINKTNALAQTKSSIIDIFINSIHQKVIDTMDTIVEASRLVVRPKRRNMRSKNVKRRKPTNYKPL